MILATAAGLHGTTCNSDRKRLSCTRRWGRGRVLGRDVVAEADEVRALVSLTGQLASVDEDLTGRENLILLARLLGFRRRDVKARADELIDAFGLSEAASRLVKNYSGGMRRRLDIAASIVATPELMFLDEPTTGLDPRSRNQVWDIIRALVAQGGDLADRLGGNPFDNTRRRYRGSGDDRRHNRRVRRIRASPQALVGLAAYEPSGFLQRPLVTLHTTRDEVVPYAHEGDYAGRVARAGAGGFLTATRIARYGHCDFRAPEVLSAFAKLVGG